MDAILVPPRPHPLAAGLYGLLNPIPFGCFAAGLVFDIVYARTAVMLWSKAAAWVILFGLLAAIAPRIVNLIQVWITGTRRWRGARLDFWLNLFGILLAIANTFIHTRDAYAVVPAAVWLSLGTVLLIAAGNVLVALETASWRAPA